MLYHTKLEEDYITRNLLSKEKLPPEIAGMQYGQLSMFDDLQQCGAGGVYGTSDIFVQG